MADSNIPVVILAGGLGTRLREETEFRPKPMVPIGSKPILWHIMKTYSYYGFNRFIICLGYKGDMIKDYFYRYHAYDGDMTIDLSTQTVTTTTRHHAEPWSVTLVETGDECFTGGRLARASCYIDTDRFFLTYGDGVANVDINALLGFHKKHGKQATLTGVNLSSRFGKLLLDGDRIEAFAEKPLEDEWINGGFFVFEHSFLEYVSTDSSCILERSPLARVARDGELMMYRHDGFWQCMDTIRERHMLEKLWQTSAPWKVWDDRLPSWDGPAYHTAQVMREVHGE